MDEYREHVKKVRKALEQDAAFLRPDPCLARRVLNAANGKGGIVVKKKVSIALVIAIVLMLSGIVAVAATLLWQDYVPQMKQTEHELGDYAAWPAARRIQLAKDIVAMGYLDESEGTRILSDETSAEQDRAAAADRLMLKLTGLDDVKEVHSTLINYAMTGHEDTWTPEQRVWWNGIVTMYGDDGAADTLIVPAKDVLSEEEAIRIARAALQEAYGFDEAYMNGMQPVADLYTTDERPEYRRWNIQLKKYREGSSTYVEQVYSAVVDENGEVISDPDVGIPHPAESAAYSADTAMTMDDQDSMIEEVYRKYGRQIEGKSIWALSVEEKAILLGGQNSVPGEGSISEADAIQAARERMSAIGYDMRPYEVSVWYIVDDADPENASADKEVLIVCFLDDIDTPVRAYAVTVDAKTGTVVDTYTPEPIH